MLKLPYWEKKNIRIYYILTAVQEAWFTESIFIYFMLRFASYKDIGFLDASSFIAGFLLEIPSGAIADKFGRRKTTIFAMSLTAVAIFIEMVAMNKWFIFISHFIYACGLALYSGSTEALAYDTLKNEGLENNADEVFEKSGLLTYFSFIIASTIGVILYKVHFRLPYLLWFITFSIGAIISFGLKEVRCKEESESHMSYWDTLRKGTLQLFSKPLIYFIPALLVFSGFYYMYDYGSVRAVMADFYGYKEIGQTIINAVFTVVIGIMVSRFTETRKLLGDRFGLILISFVVAIGFVFGGIFTNYLGGISIFLILLGGYLGYPWKSTFINKNTDSENRATTISAAAFLMKLPYAVLAIVFGYMAQNGLKAQFSLGIGVLGLLLTALTFVATRNYKKSV